MHHFSERPLIRLIAPLCCLIAAHVSADTPLDAETLLARMKTAYAAVRDYRTKVEVGTFRSDGSVETEIFLYTFKKPQWIRLDFESPHRGAILVYPAKNGKVTVRPSGLGRFFQFHLAPDNSFVRASSGQRIDQTDFGLLIRNISHSLTDEHRGPVDIKEEGGSVRVRVLAKNHFNKDVVTLYEFFIDESLWLPVKIKEGAPDGRLERSITFGDIQLNPGVPETFFQLD